MSKMSILWRSKTGLRSRRESPRPAGIAGIAGNAEPPVAEVRVAEVLPLNPRAAAGAAGCVRRVSSMPSRLSECNALQQLRVGEPRLGVIGGRC